MRRLVHPYGRNFREDTFPLAIRDSGSGAAQPSELDHSTGAHGTVNTTGAPCGENGISEIGRSSTEMSVPAKPNAQGVVGRIS